MDLMVHTNILIDSMLAVGLRVRAKVVGRFDEVRRGLQENQRRHRRSRRPAGFDAILRGDQKTAVPPHVVLLRRLFGRLLGSLLGRSFFSLPFGPGRGLRAASFFWRHRSKRHQSAAAAQAARKRFSANTEQVPERGSQIRAAEDTRRTKRSPGSRRPGPPPTG